MSLNHQTNDHLDYTVLGKGVVLKGDINLNGPTILVGRLEGQAIQTGTDRFIIESHAYFEGKLEGNDVLIYGIFNGHLSSSGKVTVFPHATVSGIIEAKSIQIFPGAWTNIEAHITGNLDNEP